MNCEQRRYFGKYRGIVANTLDPERLARLQATVPDVLGTASSTWAMPSLPFASTHAGVAAVPPVGAGVWMCASVPYRDTCRLRLSNDVFRSLVVS